MKTELKTGDETMKAESTTGDETAKTQKAGCNLLAGG